MTSRVSSKQCSLRLVLGERELCPGHDCALWDDGCAVEQIGLVPARDLARHLLDLRLRLERARIAEEQADAPRRLRELRSRGRE